MYGKKGHNLESEIQAESWTYKCLEIDVDKHLSEQERISQSHPGDILCSVSQKLLLFYLTNVSNHIQRKSIAPL